MSSCPDLSILDKDLQARQAHLLRCSTCSMFFSLREGGEEGFGSDCETAETLIAVATDATLSAIDERRLTKHLEACARCRSLSCDIFLSAGPVETAPVVAIAQPVEAASNKALPVQAPTQSKPANDQRALIFVGLGLLTLAAAVVLFLRSMGEAPKKSELTNRAAPVEPARVPALHEEPTPDPVKVEPTKEPALVLEESAVGVSRPAPPAPKQNPKAPTSSVSAGTIEQAEAAVRNTQYRKGLRLAKAILAREPGHQRATMVASLASCFLSKPKEAKRHIAGLKSSTRQDGARQVCLRLGVKLEEGADKDAQEGNSDSENEPANKQTDKVVAQVALLVEEGEELVRSYEYAKGSKVCKKALDLDPGNQRATMACAIAACNLKQAASAKRYVRGIKSKMRRNGLKQVCLRLGVELGNAPD